MDKDVEAAEFLQDLVGRAIGLGAIREVGLDNHGAPPRCGEFRGRGLGLSSML
jgi:hypothetical protein